MPRSSQEAIDLIIEEEIGTRAQYEKKYKHPEWPGGSSGITIGIGYDLGYSSPAKVMADWGNLLPTDVTRVLLLVVGLKGNEAKNALLKAVKDLVIPYDAAMQVFKKDLKENYESSVTKLPNSDELSGDCIGALTSLVYNRGASFDRQGSRYAEMRAIKEHMANREFNKIPAEIRSMKRLWVGQGLDGLLRRRDREADLFEKGLITNVETMVQGLGDPTLGQTPNAWWPNYWWPWSN
jgi:GH24 family phage-related lysozyme (muramidase)